MNGSGAWCPWLHGFWLAGGRSCWLGYGGDRWSGIGFFYHLKDRFGFCDNVWFGLVDDRGDGFDIGIQGRGAGVFHLWFVGMLEVGNACNQAVEQGDPQVDRCPFVIVMFHSGSGVGAQNGGEKKDVDAVDPGDDQGDDPQSAREKNGQAARDEGKVATQQGNEDRDNSKHHYQCRQSDHCRILRRKEFDSDRLCKKWQDLLPWVRSPSGTENRYRKIAR